MLSGEQPEPVAALQFAHIADVLSIDPHPRCFRYLAHLDELDLTHDPVLCTRGWECGKKAAKAQQRHQSHYSYLTTHNQVPPYRLTGIGIVPYLQYFASKSGT